MTADPLIDSNVFETHEIEELLSHCLYTRRTRFSLSTFSKNISVTPFVRAVSPRGPGRIDVTFSSLWTTSMFKTCAVFERLKRIVESASPCATRCDWHLMIVENGAPEQDWHNDAHSNKFYRTFIIPLSKDDPFSGTEFCNESGSTFLYNEYGGIMSFSGKVVHRGTCHNGLRPRLFLYAAVYTGTDPNS